MTICVSSWRSLGRLRILATRLLSVETEMAGRDVETYRIIHPEDTLRVEASLHQAINEGGVPVADGRLLLGGLLRLLAGESLG
ncbi:MAG: hypothetical protein ABW148_09720 [Sedimenticola sp.]